MTMKSTQLQKSSALAKFLKDKRQEVKISQKHVSEKLSFGTSQFISNWERGISMPPPNLLHKVAEIYGCDLGLLTKVYRQEYLRVTTDRLDRKLGLL